MMIEMELNNPFPIILSCLSFLAPWIPTTSKNLAFFCLFSHSYVMCPRVLVTTEASWIFLYQLFSVLKYSLQTYIQGRFSYSNKCLQVNISSFWLFYFIYLILSHQLFCLTFCLCVCLCGALLNFNSESCNSVHL